MTAVASTIFDSVLYRDVFSTPAMRAVFSDEAQLKAYVQAEVALAVAQGEAGVIPPEAAQAIARQASTVVLDSEQLKRDTENVGYPIVGLVRQLSQQLGDAGRYVHWGATTQDIMDTATVLQLREAVALIETQLVEVMATLADLARLHRDTPMAGRTHLQQALPITFGHKAAIWLSSLQRSADRLEQAKPRALQAQLGGAAGTLASLGERGLDVRAAYARALGLTEPDITWHVARDGLVEIVQTSAVICGALGKIGYDVMILMATEIGEVFEPFASHRGASSTMPQKRNPISSELMLAASKAVRQHAGLMLDAMVQDLERATGPWHAEWMAIPESFVLTAGALHQAKFALAGLVVDEKRMADNLDINRGLIVAEAVMMGLAPEIGRQEAHDVVYDACRLANEKGMMLADALSADPRVTERIDRATIDCLTSPKNYLGLAPDMVDRVLASTKRR
jgi:3-carboxy-cis,cis-muconate cycloisomerase